MLKAFSTWIVYLHEFLYIVNFSMNLPFKHLRSISTKEQNSRSANKLRSLIQVSKIKSYAHGTRMLSTEN